MTEQTKDNYDLAASRILRRLADEEGIEFVSSYGIAALTSPLSAFLGRLEQPDGRAGALADWLCDQQEVADLYASDEELEAILAAEWEGASKPEEKATRNARNPEIEERLQADPEDAELFLVYGDWLLESGDPLGELVVLQAAAAVEPSRENHQAAAQFLNLHRDYFVGRLAECPDAARLEWHMGFIRTARLWTEPAARGEYQGTILLGWLLGLPTARFIQELWLGPFDHGGADQYQEIVEELLSEPRPMLRQLTIGVADGFLADSSWSDAGELYRLAELLPALRRLEARVGHVELSTLDHPHLEELILQIENCSAAHLKAVVSASWPSLQRLDLLLSSFTLESSDLRQLGPLLAGERVPELRRLGLSVLGFADELAELLAKAPILERLEVLDLSHGGLTDGGAEVIAEHADRFAHLARLDLSRNMLTEEGAARVANVAPQVDLEDQRPPGSGDELDDEDDDGDEDERYDEIME